MNKKTYECPLRYATGMNALLRENCPATHSFLRDAVLDARKSEFDFVVEFVGKRKKIIAWNYAFEHRDAIAARYPYDGDKRCILASSPDKYWLVLNKNRDFEIIVPISKVSWFEKLDE